MKTLKLTDKEADALLKLLESQIAQCDNEDESENKAIESVISKLEKL